MPEDSEHSILQLEKLGRAACEHCGVLLNVADFHVFEKIECPECEEITTVPGKFGSYFLQHELGRGGMGAVYLAKDANLMRKVAIKVLNPKFGKNPEFVESLLCEAKAAAALNHKNIVHIFSFGNEHDQPYIVMELVDGIRLDECIDPETEQDENGWLDVMWQVALGLADAEKKGLIHGDIKPANILMNQDGVAKISDFGIARFEGSEDDRILGTPLYIAPEKSQGKPVTAKADQFSMGATFYHILSGYPPFTGKNPKEVVLNRFENPSPNIRKYAPHISKPLARMIRRMMDTDPEKRYPDFVTLAEEINSLPLKLEAQRLKKEQERKRLEEEAEALRKHQQKRKWILIGCGLVGFLILYVYMTLYR
jgi:serine/threonine-protein kinase